MRRPSGATVQVVVPAARQAMVMKATKAKPRKMKLKTHYKNGGNYTERGTSSASSAENAVHPYMMSKRNGSDIELEPEVSSSAELLQKSKSLFLHPRVARMRKSSEAALLLLDDTLSCCS